MEKSEVKIVVPHKAPAIAGIAACIIYLINPTAGVFEFLPDNLPMVGNVDETLAALLLFSLIRYLRTGKFIIPKKT